MASPISPTTGQPVSYQTNVNRAKTKRWVEAKTYNYDGDEWGEVEDGNDGNDHEQDAPSTVAGVQSASRSSSYSNQQPQPSVPSQASTYGQAHPQNRYGNLPSRQPGRYAGRIATNPLAGPGYGQPYFDSPTVTAERRAFSANSPPGDGPYAAAQRPSYSPADSYSSENNNNHRISRRQVPSGQLSPHPGQQASREWEGYPHANPVSEQRPGPDGDSRASPYPGQPISGRERPSPNGRRPSRTDGYMGRGSPHALASSPLASPASVSREGSPPKPFPPRKSSLSQHTGPAHVQPLPPQGTPSAKPAEPQHSPTNAVPLPFVRPADIYRKAAQEKQKNSQPSEEGIGKEQVGYASEVPVQEDGTGRSESQASLHSAIEQQSQHGTEDPGLGPSQPEGPIPSMTQSSNVNAKSATTENAVQDGSTLLHSSSSYNKGQDAIEAQRTTQPEEAGGNTSSPGIEDAPPSTNALQRHSSAGFTSVVHQAFQNSQEDVPPTPASNSGESADQSNNASVSDISPIIETEGERSSFSARLQSTSQEHADDPANEPLPPPVKPGFRRDSRTPSPGNSPARQRPRSLVSTELAQEESGVLSTTSTPTQSKLADDLPAAISQSESPTKGKVRDLAGRIENRSPSTSPERRPRSEFEHLTPRPANTRLESFRPSLPGGWSSYSHSIDAPSPTKSTASLHSTTQPQTSGDDDDLPIAGPPKPREEGHDTSNKAFEALAAAGTALTDAFATTTGVKQGDNSSEDIDTTHSSTRDARPAQEFVGGLSPVPEIRSGASSVPPTPPAKDELPVQQSSQPDYLPSPLRPGRSEEPPTHHRPQMLPMLSTDTAPQDTESDRLRKEIFRTLTPQSSADASRPESAERSLAARDTQVHAQQSSPPTQTLSAGNTTAGAGIKDREDLVKEGDQVARIDNPADSPPLKPQGAVEPVQSHDVAAAEADRPRLQPRFSWEESTENVVARATTSESPSFSGQASREANIGLSPGTTGRVPSDADHDSIAASKEITPVASVERKTSITSDTGDERPAVLSEAKSSEHLSPQISPKIKTADSGPEAEPSGLGLISVPTPPDPAGDSSVPALSSDFQKELPRSSSMAATSGDNTADVSLSQIFMLQEPKDRVNACNNGRQQIANHDSGLTSWLEVTSARSPEYRDLVSRNGRWNDLDQESFRVDKTSPSRSKLPWVGSSFGNAHLPLQHRRTTSGDAGKVQAGNSPGTGLSSQQMQEEGKKILHSAGKLGGKAGEAAKGFFAKGKSKWRSSSGAGVGDSGDGGRGDKVDT